MRRVSKGEAIRLSTKNGTHEPGPKCRWPMRAHRFLRRGAGRKITAMTTNDHGDPIAEGERMLLDLALYPHRSLSPRGFTILMAAIAAVSFCAGLAFFHIGAWPIVGFLGLDVLLIWGAFRLNYRAGRASETVSLSRDALTIRIADDGPGLPPDIAADIFEPFVSGRENGTGLGLALVSKLMHDGGGWITVDSVPGRTVFRLSLPLADTQDDGED